VKTTVPSTPIVTQPTTNIPATNTTTMLKSVTKTTTTTTTTQPQPIAPYLQPNPTLPTIAPSVPQTITSNTPTTPKQQQQQSTVAPYLSVKTEGEPTVAVAPYLQSKPSVPTIDTSKTNNNATQQSSAEKTPKKSEISGKGIVVVINGIVEVLNMWRNDVFSPDFVGELLSIYTAARQIKIALEHPDESEAELLLYDNQIRNDSKAANFNQVVAAIITEDIKILHSFRSKCGDSALPKEDCLLFSDMIKYIGKVIINREQSEIQRLS
jgi:hypothetical protein